MTIEDYAILGILGDTISSASYKVKHKKTEKLHVWQTVDYQNFNENEKSYFLKKINKRTGIKHPNVLQFFEHIDQKENKILYLVTEYCHNQNVKKVMQYCIDNNMKICEELICKILHQSVSTLKSIENFIGLLNTEEIFIDQEYNVKLYNFNCSGNKNNKIKEPKMSTLGILMYEMCTLKKFDKHQYEKDFKELYPVYSGSFITLLSQMIKDNNELRKNIEKIVCHPTLLLKSNDWSIEKCFFTITDESKPSQKSSEQVPVQENGSYSVRMEKLRNKELALQIREQKLTDKERKLVNREKKVALMERLVKEKLSQAELYLKRCRETKSTTSAGSKGSNEQFPKLSYENLDSTYVDCGESVIVTTSKKMDVKTIAKPTTFVRSMSERRIRFKGHSPLKELDMNKRRSIRHSKLREKRITESDSDWKTCSENSEKSSTEGSRININIKSRQLFNPYGSEENIYENDFEDCELNQNNNEEIIADCKPIGWTEESKRYAFEMLRIMNVDKENNYNRDKETFKQTHL